MIVQATLLRAARQIAGEMRLSRIFVDDDPAEPLMFVSNPVEGKINIFTDKEYPDLKGSYVPGIHVTAGSAVSKGDLFFWYMPGGDPEKRQSEGFDIRIHKGEIISARARKGRYSHELTRALSLITEDSRLNQRALPQEDVK